jgi:exopolysaccharide biosynthesis protein
VPGGHANTAGGDYSFAAGDRVSITSDGDYTFAFGSNFTTSASHAVIFHDSGTPIKVGIGTTAPNATTDIDGDMALRAGSLVAVNGSNNDVSIGARSLVRITGPNLAFAITGIAGGQDGKIVILFNTTAQNMTIANESANSLAANRILTMSGADETTVGTGNITLIYDSTAQRWIVTAIKP